jgi:hypothetical protein
MNLSFQQEFPARERKQQHNKFENPLILISAPAAKMGPGPRLSTLQTAPTRLCPRDPAGSHTPLTRTPAPATPPRTPTRTGCLHSLTTSK